MQLLLFSFYLEYNLFENLLIIINLKEFERQ